MKMRRVSCGRLATVVLLVFFATGCSNQHANTTQTAAVLDPVQSFKAIVSGFPDLDGFEFVSERNDIPKMAGWWKYRPRMANVEYDVKNGFSSIAIYGNDYM